jgi:hypothetical protein
MLGGFFCILSVTVLSGTLWELDQPRAAIVNAASSFVLLAVGGGMLAIARRLRRRAES